MEQRLIDANALWELMRTYDDYQGAKEAHDLELIHRDSILFAIENAPTVDAVQVVRCGECKYWDRSDPFFFNGVVRCECKRHENEYWTADGFCSDAERNDSEIPNS